MIEQGVRLFDRLTVAVGVNPDKSYTFPLKRFLARKRIYSTCRFFAEYEQEARTNLQYSVRNLMRSWRNGSSTNISIEPNRHLSPG